MVITEEDTKIVWKLLIDRDRRGKAGGESKLFAMNITRLGEEVAKRALRIWLRVIVACNKTPNYWRSLVAVFIKKPGKTGRIGSLQAGCYRGNHVCEVF